MKKLTILFVLTGVLFSGCNFFNGKKEMREYIERLENSLKDDSLEYAAHMESLKRNMQLKIDSITEACAKPKGNFHIISGSFREQQNADRFLIEMEKLGYKSQIIDAPNGFHLVSVFAGTSLQEMFATLNKIRNSVNEESWIYINN